MRVKREEKILSHRIYILSIILIFASLGIFISGFYMLNELRCELEECIVNLEVVTDQSALILESRMDSTITSLKNASEVYEPGDEGVLNMMSVVKKNHGFLHMAMVDENGDGIFDDGTAVSEGAPEEYCIVPLRAGETSVILPYVNGDGIFQVTVGVPIIREGSVVGAIYANCDVTELFRNCFSALYEGCDFTFVINEEGAYIRTSEDYDQELLGDNFYDYLVDNGNSERYVSELRQAVKDNQCETLKVTINGESHMMHFQSVQSSVGWYVITVVPVKYINKTSQNIMRYLLMLSLLTMTVIIIAVLISANRIKAKIQISQMEQAVIAANAKNKAKSDFLSLMSHEIRTPMNSIVGISQLARTYANDYEKIEDCLKKLDMVAKYLLSLINDILDMSMIEQGQLVLVPAPFSLNKMIKMTEYIYRPVIEDKDQTFVVVSYIEHDSVTGDMSRIQQVVTNLVSNATKYTEKGGHIELEIMEISSDDEYSVYEFSVRDNGSGIDEENLERVLKPFEQVRRITVPDGLQGTGLGLSISRSILNAMESDLVIDSRIGEGSTFSFVLRLRHASVPSEEIEAQMPPEEAQTESEVLKNLAGAKILIADDNDMNSGILAELLASEGVVSSLARDGYSACEIFRKSGVNEFDAILMDIQMPVMDGLTAARTIRSMGRPDSRTVPIIAITAFAFNEDVENSIKAGMNAHTSKPIDVEKICGLLDRLISEREENENGRKRN